MTILLFLHVISAVVWVGGMFLAYVAVRPAVVEILQPPQRLALWAGILRRFLAWVWVAVILILGSGFGMLAQMGQAPLHIHLMLSTGVVMSLIFLHLYFAPYRRLRRAVAAQDWKAGGVALSRIRILVGVNLTLGLITVAVAILGRLL